MMPEMDGFALAEQIKRHPELARATIMMLSSADHSRDMARCRVSGISSYLVKPIKQSELLDAILDGPEHGRREGAADGHPPRGPAAPDAAGRASRPLRILRGGGQPRQPDARVDPPGEAGALRSSSPATARRRSPRWTGSRSTWS